MDLLDVVIVVIAGWLVLSALIVASVAVAGRADRRERRLQATATLGLLLAGDGAAQQPLPQQGQTLHVTSRGVRAVMPTPLR